MCPVCIASTAIVVAAGGSTGGILALCSGKLKRCFKRFGLFIESKGETRWQAAKRQTSNTAKGIAP